jgi:sulfite exporter TauE/SafE
MIADAQFASMLLSALLVGLLGSGHCFAMCGGFASAFSISPKPAASVARSIRFLLLYNAGRVISYSIAGALAGFLGATTLHLFEIETARLVGRLLASFFIIAVGLYLAGFPQILIPIEKAGQILWRYISPLATGLLPAKSNAEILLIGLLWGWLPCGLVYSVLVTAMTTGGALRGALVMSLFGLGTLPALFAIGMASGFLNRFARDNRFRVGAGSVVVLLGLYTLFDPHTM